MPHIVTDPLTVVVACGTILFFLLLAFFAENEERQDFKNEQKKQDRPYDWRVDLPRKDRIKRGW